MFNTRFDLIVSIGANCGCAMLLNDVGLRLSSGPFDWLAMAPFNTRIATLSSRFSDFLVRENIVWKDEGRADRASDVYQDAKNGYAFIHDFPKGVALNRSFPEVKAKYDRRIKRLLDAFDAGKRVCLVWRDMERTPSDAECASAMDALQKAYPRATFALLVLANDLSADRVESRTFAKGRCIRFCGCFMPPGSEELVGNRGPQRKILRHIPCSADLYRRCLVFEMKRGLARVLSLWHLTRAGRKRARKYWTDILCKRKAAESLGW